jgi:hypothetical protein
VNGQLIPADLTRCQAEVPNGATFMSLGGVPRLERCHNAPTVIATEKRPGEDGLVGSMSLCARCQAQFIKQLGNDFATFESIEVAQ